MLSPVELTLPFRGRWLVQNSPADRVPSHGTAAFGTAYAIDFVPVDDDGQSAPWTLRGRLLSQPADHFIGFGRELLAPVDGVVAAVHDGEPDHGSRRSLLGLLLHGITQLMRVRRGAPGLAGNHVVIEVPKGYVLLAHLRRETVRHAVGDRVQVGDVLGECGNSGNSTEPHLHLQVSDTMRLDAKGVPIVFRRPGGSGPTSWVPSSGEIIDAE